MQGRGFVFAAITCLMAVSVAPAQAGTAQDAAGVAGAQKAGLASQAQLELLAASPASFVDVSGCPGAAAGGVRFALYGSGVSIFHTTGGPVFQVFERDPKAGAGGWRGLPQPRGAGRSCTFSASFPGAVRVQPFGSERQQAHVNWYAGSEQSSWRASLPTYAAVVYPGLYEGIDLHTWGKRSHLKYEFHVAPGADYRSIAISYDGIDGLWVDASGALHVRTPLGELVDEAPVVYQEIGGRQVPVPARYRLIGEAGYGFELTAPADPNAELVIDPDLTWSTFLGGSGIDEGAGIASDPDGNALVTGNTYSMNFPTPNGIDTSLNGNNDAFVTKVDADGHLAWSTYIGGSGFDYGRGIACDRSGNVLVTGGTGSNDFPRAGAFDASYNGGDSDAFVAKLDRDGQLIWASYLGGSNADFGRGIAADSAGNVIVVGETRSGDFPYLLGFDATGGTQTFSEGFVTKITPSGSRITWSTFLGGTGGDICYSVATDFADNIVVGGYTASGNFPLLTAFDPVGAGASEGFVTKITPACVLVWSSYFGGNGTDEVLGITCDSAASIYITGDTSSTDLPMPGNAYDKTFNGGNYDAFAAKVSNVGKLLWTTYLGGTSADTGCAISADPADNVLVSGYTASSTDFPTASGFDTTYNEAIDGFVLKLTGAAGTLLWSSYIGGSDADYAYGVAASAAGGHALITGFTASTDFPTTAGLDTGHNGGRDAFVAKVLQPAHQLDVQSMTVLGESLPGIAITGSRPGTTNYSTLCAEQQVVTLAAPTPVTVGGRKYNFARWEVGVYQQTTTTLVLAMDAPHTAVAFYAVQEYTLTVSSSPVKAVPISGTRPGSTDYTAKCPDQLPVMLTAPASHTSSATYAFAYWKVDGAARPRGQRDVYLAMAADAAAEAVYEVSPPLPVTDLAAHIAAEAQPVSSAGSSGEYSSDFSAAKAADGAAATVWSTPSRSTSQAEFLKLDLGSVRTIHGTRLLPSATLPQLFPDAFTIEVSENNVAWTPAASVTGYSAQAGTWCEVSFAGRPARYVRASIPQDRLYQAGVYMIQIAEFQALRQFVELTLTAKGGTSYDIRHSTAGPVTAGAWDAASQAANEPVPADPGVQQAIGISLDQLPAETTVHLALKTADAAGGISALSNSASVQTPGMPPATVTDLAVTGTTATSLTVSFTATGDDGTLGTATSYDLRWSTAEITSATWASAQQAAGLPAPSPPGEPESLTLPCLPEDSQCYVALRVFDEIGNGSAISNVAAGKTLDLTAPAPTDSLQAALVSPGPLVKMTVTTATGSGDHSAPYVAANTIDGQTDTVWSTPARAASQAEWMLFDLGGAEALEKVRLLPNAGAPQLFPSHFSVWVSADNAAWVQVAAEASYAAAAGTWYEANFPSWPARYVRVSIAEDRLWSPGVYMIQVAEAEVYGALRQVKLDVHSAAGTDEFPGYPASATIDGRADTVWSTTVQAAPRVETLTLDLGREETVEKVRLLPNAGAPQLFPQAFTLQVSGDGSAWTDAASEAGYAPAAGVWYQKAIAPVGARYVRLRAPATPMWAPGQYVLQMAEAEVYGLNRVLKCDVAAVMSSGSHSALYGEAKAADGLTDTIWSTPAYATAQPASLTFDLGHALPIERVRLLPAAGAPGLFPSAFTIDTSADGSAWSEAASISGYAAAAASWCTVNFPAAQARLVRLSIPACRYFSPGVYMIQLAEMEAYRTGEQVVRLNWLASGDNGSAGSAASYDVRWKRSAVTDGTWGAATALAGEPSAVAAGSPRAMTVGLDLLPPGRRVYFGLKSADEAGNQSTASNSPYVDVPGTPEPELEGDANGDCKVNLLDLLFVRQRLNQDVGTGDNAKADVNADGKINLLDLLFIRSRLNNTCS